MLSFAPLLVAALLLAPRPSTPVIDAGTEAAVLDAPTRHIRTMDAAIRKLLKRGVRHSPSFAALVTRLLQEEVEDILRLLPTKDAETESRYRKAAKIALQWIKNYLALDYRSLGSYTRADLERIAAAPDAL